MVGGRFDCQEIPKSDREVQIQQTPEIGDFTGVYFWVLPNFWHENYRWPLRPDPAVVRGELFPYQTIADSDHKVYRRNLRVSNDWKRHAV